MPIFLFSAAPVYVWETPADTGTVGESPLAPSDGDERLQSVGVCQTSVQIR